MRCGGEGPTLFAPQLPRASQMASITPALRRGMASSTRRFFVGGNFKANGSVADTAVRIGARVAVCGPSSPIPARGVRRAPAPAGMHVTPPSPESSPRQYICRRNRASGAAGAGRGARAGARMIRPDTFPCGSRPTSWCPPCPRGPSAPDPAARARPPALPKAWPGQALARVGRVEPRRGGRAAEPARVGNPHVSRHPPVPHTHPHPSPPHLLSRLRRSSSRPSTARTSRPPTRS